MSTFIERFNFLTGEFGNKDALIYHCDSVNYTELDRKSNQTAYALLNRGIAKGDAVPIRLPRGINYVIAQLGVLKAGAAMVNLDSNFPVERVDFIAGDCKAKLIIDEEFMNEIDVYSQTQLNTDIRDDDLAYIVYTSGSTGAPKGILHSHKSIYTGAGAVCEALGLAADFVALSTAPFYFAAHMLDLFSPLYQGLTVHIADERVRKDIRLLEEYIDKHKVSFTYISPQLLRQFISPGNSLQTVITAGEKLSGVSPGGFRLFNIYGLSETCTGATYFEVDRAYDNTPIGKAFSDCEVMLLDAENKPLSEGEICISGRIARGYLNLNEQTKERFVEYDGKTWFRSGDLGQLLPDGNIQYINRNDWMLKINGQRVEPGEIESAIRRLEAVGDAAVKGFENEYGQTYLCGYYTCKSPIEPDEIKDALKNALPPYMIPVFLIKLTALPLNQNGKLDRKALLPPDAGMFKAEYASPENEVQRILCKAFEEVLNVQNVGIDDDFFSLGGDSIKTLMLQSKCERIGITSEIVFSGRTPRGIAPLCGTETSSPYAGFERERPYYPLTDSQMGVYLECLKNPGTTMYNIPSMCVIPKSTGVETEKLKRAVFDAVGFYPFLNVRADFDSNGEPSILPRNDLQFDIPVAFVSEEDISGIAETFSMPFDLSVGPLFRFAIYETEHTVYLLLDFHHILTDGTSYALFLSAVGHAYDGTPIPPEQVTSFTLSNYEETLKDTQKYTEAKGFFQNMLSEKVIDSNIPPDFRGDEKAQSGTVALRLSDCLPILETEQFLKKRGLTENTLFLSAFAYTLSRFSAQDKALFCTLNNGRHELELKNTMGMLVRTVPFYLEIDEDTTVDEYLNTVQSRFFEAMKNDCCSFGDLSRELGIKADIMFVYQADSLNGFTFNGNAIHFKTMETADAKTNLTVMVFKRSEGYELSLRYRSDMYSEDTITRFADIMSQVLCGLVSCKRLKDITDINKNVWEQLYADYGRAVQMSELYADIDIESAYKFCEHYGAESESLFLAGVLYTISRFTNSREIFLSKADTEKVYLEDSMSGSVLDFVKSVKELVNNSIVKSRPISFKIADECEACVIERDSHISVRIRYNDTPQKSELAHNYAESVAAAVTHMAENANAPISKISLLGGETKRLIESFRQTCEYSIEDKLLHVMFEKQVSKNPGKTALIATDVTLTYEQLNSAANKLAHGLIERGVKPGSTVAILLPRTSKFFIAMFGILKAGAAFIPCDTEYPPERINQILTDSDADFVITMRNSTEQLDESKSLDAEELLLCENHENPNVDVKPDDLAYMIYTSGSTGKPKGVMLKHEGICSYLYPHETNIHMYALERNAQAMLSVTTISFDMSLKETAGALCNGLTLVFANEDETRSPMLLAELFERTGADAFNATSSRLYHYLELPAFCDAISKCKVVMSGGEKYDIKLLEKLQSITKAKIFNTYGPTEITVSSNVKDLTNERSISVGRPLLNYKEFIVDADGNELPPGVVGELYVGGIGVAKGYRNLPEMTAERFVEYNGIRVYKTGDYAMWQENGDVVVLGRLDNQVKIRGLRVELGEIEAALGKFNGVKEAVVLIREMNGTEHICAYYTGHIEIDVDALKESLKQSLTHYMIPTAYLQLDKMPVTPNGKIDIKALPEPVFSSGSPEAYGMEHTTRSLTIIGRQLSEIAADILGHNEFDITTNLNYCGLSSLSAIKLAVAVSKKFGASPNVGKMMKECTLAALEDEVQIYLLENIGKSTKEMAHQKQMLYPLSKTQMGIYYDVMKHPQEIVYNVPSCLCWPKGVDTQRLSESVARVINAHPYIKTHLVLEHQTVMQVRSDDTPPVIEMLNMSDEQFDDFKVSFVRPFDLFKPPLYRAAVVETDTRVGLFTDFHHIISDGGSADIFLAALSRAYAGEDLEPEAYDYFDFVTDEAIIEQSEDYKKADEYFREMLKNCEGASEIPNDLYGNKDAGGSSEAVVNLDMARVTEFCRSNGVTPASLFLSGVFYAASRFINSRDVYISTISNGRRNLKIQNSFGMFVNTLPLAASINPDMSTIDFIRQSGDTLNETISNECYPFVKIAAEYNFMPKMVYACQLGVVEGTVVLGGKAATRELLELKTPKFNISVNIEERDSKAAVCVEYNNAIYTPYLMDIFAESIAVAVSRMLESSNAPIGGLSLLSAEKESLVSSFRKTAECDIEDKLLHMMFEKQVAKNGAKTALIATDATLTYAELNTLANRLAHSLIERGVKPGGKVAILLPRTSRFFIAMFGILKAGAAFIPCDTEYPAERIRYVLSDSGAEFVITTSERFGDFGDGNAIGVEELLRCETAENPNINVTPEDLAYLIYTSGSTGKPKGVMLRHEGICNYLYPHDANIHIRSLVEKDCSIMSVTTVSFDMSFKETTVALCNGLTLIFANEDEAHNPVLLAELFERTGADAFNATPSRFYQYLELPAFCEAIAKCKVVMSGGEKYSEKLLKKLQSITKAEIFNTYGPTEITVSSNAKNLTAESSISIGKPLLNYREFIVDSDGNELPPGVAGELYVGGPGVAKGYQNLAEMSAEKFIIYKGERVYKTGDYAMWKQNGDVDVLGRTDNQIKIRGLRVELSEIDAAIGRCNGVKDVAVLIKEINQAEHICAYYTACTLINAEDLKEALKKTLPQYMVPTSYTQLDEMPFTANGKIDAKSLPAPSAPSLQQYTEPIGENEKIFCDIFAKVLKLDKVGASDNFFDLGGTSLVVTSVIVEALKYNYEITYGDVFAYPTPKKLAALFGESDDAVVSGVMAEDISKYDYSAINDILKRNTLDAFRSGKAIDIGDILLTGATGFLGIHILREFITLETGRAYCFIRKGRYKSAEARLKSTLFYYFEDDFEQLFGERIIVVDGDITNKEALMSLQGKNIDTVFNCAANVKHFSDGTDIEDVNYFGVLNILDFCLKSGARLVHISTTSIAGLSIDGNPPKSAVLTEQSLYLGQALETKYTRSKFLAERAILESVAGGLNAKIMRVGNLSARDVDGEFQMNFATNSFVGRLKSYNLIGKFPYSMMNGTAELAPIDSTARAIILLSHAPDECCVFHPYNNHGVYMGDIIMAMRNAGLSIDLAEDEEYAQALQTASADSKKVKVLSSMIAYQNMGHGRKTERIEKPNSYTAQVLYRMNWQWPISSPEYMSKLINSLIGLGYFEMGADNYV